MNFLVLFLNFFCVDILSRVQKIVFFVIFSTTGIRVWFRSKEEGRVTIIFYKRRKKTKRLKSNNFINMANHYSYNDRFKDEVEDKIKIYETFHQKSHIG